MFWSEIIDQPIRNQQQLLRLRFLLIRLGRQIRRDFCPVRGVKISEPLKAHWWIIAKKTDIASFPAMNLLLSGYWRKSNNHYVWLSSNQRFSASFRMSGGGRSFRLGWGTLESWKVGCHWHGQLDIRFLLMAEMLQLLGCIKPIRNPGNDSM